MTYSPSQVRSARPRTRRGRSTRTDLQDGGASTDRHPAAGHASSRLCDRQARAGTISQHDDILPRGSDGDEEGIVQVEVRGGPGPGDGGGPEIRIGTQRQVMGDGASEGSLVYSGRTQHVGEFMGMIGSCAVHRGALEKAWDQVWAALGRR